MDKEVWEVGGAVADVGQHHQKEEKQDAVKTRKRPEHWPASETVRLRSREVTGDA